VADLHVASVITGPTHNVLGLRLSLEPAAAVSIEPRPIPGEEPTSELLTDERVLAWVQQALDEFNASHGTFLRLHRLQYVPSDTPTC
jgi:hypothetical protein